MVTFLTWATLIVVLAIVAAVAVHLILILAALRRAGDHLEALAGGLAQIRDDTRPLNERVDAINGGLAALLPPLMGAHGDLAAIVAVASGKKPG